MATINPTANLSGLARRLVMDGLLNEEDWGLNAGGGVRWFDNPRRSSLAAPRH